MTKTNAFIPQVAPSVGEAEVEHLSAYLRSGGWLTEFEETERFERMIAEWLGVKYCSVVNNGTVTLVLSLMALEVGSGDEVVVPDLTMIATPNAVKLVGASPVMADINPDTLCVDADTVQAAISPRTRALMLVSLNGRFPADIAEIQALCERNGIALIEDAAQAFGSRHAGRPIGTYGVIGSFSFSPHKIITTGQGGALVTNDERLHRRIERLKDFGRDVPGRDVHPFLGWNFKFTDVQAVIGIEQMKRLEERISRKRAMFERYRTRLRAVDVVEFVPTNLAETTPWFMDILCDDPTTLATALKQAGVGTRPFYPPVHSQPIYPQDGARFPVTSRVTARGLWLPSSVALADAQIDYVCDCVRSHFLGS